MKHYLIPVLKACNHLLAATRAAALGPAIRQRHYARALPAGERVLILAPHMDDEVIGCGGSIRLYTRAGGRVACVYMTDGAYGLTGCEREEMRQTRRREAGLASELLGLSQLYFLDQPDGNLHGQEALERKLAEIIAAERPEVVYFPYPFDTHPDHKNLFGIFARAAKRLPARLFHMYWYQVQVPLGLDEIHTVIDISPVLAEKHRALAAYQSQTRVPFAVIDHLQGCQRYLIGRAPKAVEVFGRVWESDFPEIFRRLGYCGGQIKNYAEVGAHAIRRARWI